MVCVHLNNGNQRILKPTPFESIIADGAYHCAEMPIIVKIAICVQTYLLVNRSYTVLTHAVSWLLHPPRPEVSD